MTVSDTSYSRIEQCLQHGQLIEASEAIGAWLADAPDDPHALTARACLLRLLGRHAEAAPLLERAYAQTTDFPPTLLELARLARLNGDSQRALAWYEAWYDAWRKQAPHRSTADSVATTTATAAFDEWVMVLHAMGQYDLAAQIAARWCEVCPQLAQAWFQQGLSYQMNNALQPALAAYQRALPLDYEYPSLLNNIGALHESLGEHDVALRFCNEAIRVDPADFRAWTNASNAWLALRDPQRALIAVARARALAPDYPPALLALSNVLKEMQRWDEALEPLVHLVQIGTADAKIQWSIAMLQLLRGDYENGLINHEARWQGSSEMQTLRPLPPEQRWNGENLAGKTLLVWGEQGFGDVFQFVRFVPLIAGRVRAEGGTLVYCCVAQLVPLLSRSLAHLGLQIVPHDAPQLPHFDRHLPLGSVPLALGITLANLPAPRAYLQPDAARVAYWRERLARTRGLKVGLVWSGSRGHKRNPLRAVPPADYARAFRALSGVEFVSLQLDGRDELATMVAEGLTVTDYTADLRSFDETAALLSSLDLVITVCTSVAHLSGALGVPTWLLLDVCPHWVWMLERSDSPWYPSITLYRQPAYRDWAPVMERVAADLRRRIEGSTARPPAATRV
ncbi:tetratricopeptide repeat protein [Paraburkholderia kururiensis]|uniref:Tetratricopeptide repeat-containing glycosyltransferase family protein n=1 Tax=Paraburkholderia kururiensis TaxID=984307 RepID=A0ABZ0WHS7_9BURK|nr:tetratricopeptide repeat-containing glycosyltransferase family protein [Paraburkholderia kururiensis]WQD76914.1 tetratricopeptide repeat-containing glycosyltransferase family protein [Paraburkholderia kururiensis]